MQAMQFTAYGGTDKLKLTDIAEPTPSRTQVLVKVYATSVNPIDWKLHNGMLRWVKPVKFPATPCFDFAGIVEAAGPDVTGYRVGDRVFGMLPVGPQGAAAEYVAVDADLVGKLPPGLDDFQAAGLPLAGMTALQAMRDEGRLQPGQALLVVGASGGVGHYAVQIGKALGASVTAVCSHRNIEFAGQLGADDVLDYTSPGFQVPKARYHVVLDAAAHDPIAKWLPGLVPQGSYVTLLPGVELGLRRVAELFGQPRVRFAMVKPNASDLAWLAGLAEQGKLRTQIDQTFPLSELGSALEKSQGQRVRGKLIVEIGADKNP